MADQKAGAMKRRIVFIEKSFQTRFIIIYCLLGLAAMVLASVVLYWFSQDSYTMSYRYNRLGMTSTAQAITPELVGINLAVFFFLLVSTIYVTLYISFRIGGPLFRFSKDMEVIGQGHLAKRIRLRQGDQLIKFANSINGMAEQLDQKVGSLQKELDALNAEANKSGCTVGYLRERIERLNKQATESFETSA